MADMDVAEAATMTPAERAAENKRFVAANLPRNFLANFVHGMLGLTGFRMMYAPTFIPAYMHLLTGSATWVGIGTALLQLGAILSPIIGASKIEHRPRMLPYAVRAGSMMRLQILGLALAGWFLSGTSLLVVTLILFFALGFFTGVQKVAFQMLMAKVIPIDRRGRLQAYRNMCGGAIAATLSLWAGSYLVERNVWGNGYATTFFCTFVLTSLGLTFLQFIIREPGPVKVRIAIPFRERVRQFPALLADRDYRWFLGGQALALWGRCAAPFYVIYAGKLLDLDGKTLGMLSFAFLGADTMSNIVWGTLGDKYGYRLTFILSSLTSFAAIPILLTAVHPIAIFVAFGALGAGSSGYLMSVQTMVLEFGSSDDTAMRMALSTTLESSITAAGPLLAGLLASLAGYDVLFSLTMAFFGAACLILLAKVREPRHLKARTIPDPEM